MTAAAACALLEVPHLESPADQYALEMLLRAAGAPGCAVDRVLAEVQSLLNRVEELQDELEDLESRRPDVYEIECALNDMESGDVVRVLKHGTELLKALEATSKLNTGGAAI